MSDGFDKEAEREKLREQLAEDEQKREHTQRMSELLLQGATMTNRHCDDCGDPIFRHDGQEFCPTCQATGSPAAAQGGDAQPADGDAEGQPQGDARDRSTPRAEEQAVPSTASRNATDPSGAPSAASSPEQPGAEPTSTPSTAPTESGTVADARASLTRTLTRFARAAEETDDPRRARDHLQAAREAAEALAALD